MGREEITERILADAERDCERVLSDAEARAKSMIGEAEASAFRAKEETRAETEAQIGRLFEVRSAAARLDAQKLALGEKRRVLDVLYALALNALVKMNEKDSLALFSRLIEEYAEQGDEVVFAENFAYAEAAARLPVLKERGLTVAKERAKLEGGFMLRGKVCDKDLSYGALLSADAEENRAALAARLFGAR